MTTTGWGEREMLDILVEQAGLPPEERPTDLDVTFGQLGLDSLAYIQLQAAVHGSFGIELPDEFPAEATLAAILADIQRRIGARTEEMA